MPRGGALYTIAARSQQLRQPLPKDCRAAITDVRSAVDDWRPMRERLDVVRALVREGSAPVSEAERSEADAFLGWMADNHFTFLGYRAYSFTGSGAKV